MICYNIISNIGHFISVFTCVIYLCLFTYISIFCDQNINGMMILAILSILSSLVNVFIYLCYGIVMEKLPEERIINKDQIISNVTSLLLFFNYCLCLKFIL